MEAGKAGNRFGNKPGVLRTPPAKKAAVKLYRQYISTNQPKTKLWIFIRFLRRNVLKGVQIKLTRP